MLPTINMLWIGGALGYLEQLSATSFLAAGHRVMLHAYGPVANVPVGVELADAGELMPTAAMHKLRHQATSSHALASDFFRFRLQREGKGIWADIDVICLSPIEIDAPVILGWESEHYVNGAVMYLERNSEVLSDAIAAFRPNSVPDWVPPIQAMRFQVKKAFGRPFGPADLPRGTFGPKALTALLRRHRLTMFAQPTEVFYPLHPRHARVVFEPETTMAAFLTENTKTVHLWNEKLGELKSRRPPSTSALGRLLKNFGI
ncbi:MAG TPA: hypothetical protein VIL84_13500 [Devosiaceae bacterium]